MNIAWADQWLPPRPKIYQSPEGRYRLTVFPREIAGALSYFEDKVEDRELAGQSAGGQTRCEATLEKKIEDGYETIWRKPLVNDVAPVSALISDADGRFVTFDNWHSAGKGDDAIVVYSGSGEVRRQLKLTDIMSESEFSQLPRSISSIHWGGQHQIDDADPLVVNLQVLVRQTFERSTLKSEFRTVQIRLDTAEVVK